jgi:LacI family transcriptional regulator, galactose operon repressor
MKKISLDTMAKELGVSKTLVSLVLNGRGDKNGISKDTQERVLDLAKKLNYKPNLIARGLRTGRSNILGLIVADIGNPFYAKIARGIEDKAIKEGYDLIICSSDEKVDREAKLIHMLRDRQIDGLIISSTQDANSETINLINENFPVVLIDRYFPGVEANTVVVDNVLSAYNATQHLIQQEFRKIALLTISPSHISSLNERQEGYKKALQDNSIELDPNLIYEVPFDDIKNSVKNAIDYFITQGADAIFTLNNNLTLASLEYLHQKEILIPDQISLLSFDDLDLFKLSNPPISSIWQPLKEICEQSVNLLIDEINQKTVKKRKIVLQTELKVRKSTQLVHAK